MYESTAYEKMWLIKDGINNMQILLETVGWDEIIRSVTKAQSFLFLMPIQ